MSSLFEEMKLDLSTNIFRFSFLVYVLNDSTLNDSASVLSEFTRPSLSVQFLINVEVVK
jgi:hypothetical protein